MKNQKIRSMKVHEQSGYNYKATPTIILKGQWLKEMGFEIGDYITVSCEDGNTDVREHFASFKSDDVLSLDQFMDEATSEDSKGFEPASPENLEETVMLRMIIQDLLKKIHEINPKHGRILDLICEDYTKGQILDELGLGKSQGYADIKAAQALAKKLYFGE